MVSQYIQRKEHERALREVLILDAAEEAFFEEGYLGLKMDDIASRVGYSKGTLYQHFSSKEDMLLAVAVRQKTIYASWFTRAATFEGRSRERIHAIGLADRLFRQRHPGHIDNEQLLQQRSIWDKTSESWREKMRQSQKGCELSIHAIIGEALASGDLSADQDTLDMIVLGLRALSIGVHMLVKIPESDDCTHLKSGPLAKLNAMQHHYLDSFNWQPLFAEWDYQATEERLVTTIFSDLVSETAAS